MDVVTPEREHVAREQVAPGGAGPAPVPPAPRRQPPWRLVAVALVAVALVVGVGKLGDLLPSFHNPFATRAVDRTQPAVLKAIEDMSEYRAATGHFQVVIDLEKDARYIPSFIKGERTLFVAAGSVEAGVDLSRVGQDAIEVSEGRDAVEVTLPRARLADARVDPRRSYVVSRDRGLVDRLGSVFSDSPTGERQLYLLAEQKLEAAAREGDLVDAAERNTRSMLESMLRSLGFSRVSVTFASEPAP